MQIKAWNMTYGEYGDLACTVPCSMYSVLLEHGIIEDPFYGLNESEAAKLSDRDCTFAGSFDADEALLAHDFIELTFYGLDTICGIYLNDILLAEVNDMHCAYTYDVRALLKQGENQIRLEFGSPTRYFKKKNSRHYLWSGNDCIPGAAHLRKALCMSGWDWGPKLPDMGIFRPVEIKAYDTDAIADISVLQNHRETGVELEIAVTVKQNAQTELYAEINGKRICLQDGKGRLTIENPRLWWVRGYGEQYLYDLNVEMVCDGRIVDSASRRIGLRTLTVSTEEDKYGNEFCFVINGVKIFAMGANYIPQDSLLGRITRERTLRLLQDCVDANFNCIRVWGGGYYPEDDFYDLCDELGLMVWQDFMVACANVRLTREFEENFVREAVYNIKRFRNHACLALFCGNNEVEEAITEWEKIGDSELVKRDYLRLYEQILPQLVEDYAPQTFYWPSSPSCGGGFDNPTDKLRGDTHYWVVWHGNAPFTEYRRHLFRFCSEYGFESFPSMKTIRTFCEEKDQNAFSRVMENHQKCRSGNGKIVNYIADNYLYPGSFEKLVYTSQLLQAEAVKYGVEHFRRIRGICMGSIYWQLNDCWPVASWSSIDYFGRYKALHYAEKKFYAPVAMGLFMEEDVLTVNVSNETREGFQGSIRVRLCRNDFSIIREEAAQVSVAKLESADIYRMRVRAEDKYSNYISVILYDAGGGRIMEQTELLVKPKHYSFEKPTIKAIFTQQADGVEITVSSDRFAKAVEIDFADLDCRLSENFFDITDSAPRSIFAKTSYTAGQMEQGLTVRSVYDIG